MIKSKTWPVAARLLAILVGALFALSAVAKLATLQGTARMFIQFNLFESREVAMPLIRVLCGGELFLGLAMMQRQWVRRVFIPTLWLILLGFCVFLVHLMIEGVEDCGCLGELMKMSPLQALVKNLVTAVCLGISFRFLPKDPPSDLRLPSFLAVLSLGVALAWPYAPPETTSTGKVTLKAFAQKAADAGIQLMQGEKLVAFFSMDCEHCREIAGELCKLQTEAPIPEIVVAFLGDPSMLPEFLAISGSDFPHFFTDAEDFFKYIGDLPPRIYHISGGEVVEFWDIPEGGTGEFIDRMRTLLPQ